MSIFTVSEMCTVICSKSQIVYTPRAFVTPAGGTRWVSSRSLAIEN